GRGADGEGWEVSIRGDGEPVSTHSTIVTSTSARARRSAPLRIADFGLRIAQSTIRDPQSAIERDPGRPAWSTVRTALALAALVTTAFAADTIKIGEYT